MKEVIIELTGKCNLDCSFCYNKNKKSSLDTNKIFEILEQIKRDGIKAVRFTGGEPFLRKDLDIIIKKAKNLGLYVILNTNGTLLTKANKQILNQVDLVLFSFHNYNQILKYKLIANDFMITTIMNKKNIDDLEMFYKKTSKIKNTNFIEWFLLRQIPNDKEPSPLSFKDVEILYAKVIELNRKYNMNIKISNALPYCSTKKKISKIAIGGKFDSGYQRVIVDTDGNIILDYTGKIIGNIDQNIFNVWKNYKRSIPEYCKKCFYFSKCLGGLENKEYLRNFENVKHLASVIIPTFNNKAALELLLQSLENQSISNFEIIIVDDGSTDDTKVFVQEYIKNSNINVSYNYLSNTDIFGAGIARNYGAKQAKTDILIFLDQDCVAHPKLIENHLKLQDKENIVLGYYAGYNNKIRYDFDKLKTLIKNNSLIKPILLDFRHNHFKNKGSWKYFVSANFSIKKSFFQDFDEKFKEWGCEDVELGYRLNKEGHNIFFAKSCIAYNSSNDPMITEDKLISLMKSLKYFNEKYDVKDYVIERFYTVPLNIRKKYKLNHETLEIEEKLI